MKTGRFAFNLFCLLLLAIVAQGSRSVSAHEVAQSAVSGDCNGNGWLGTDDIEKIKDELFQNDGYHRAQCDANGDGKLDAGDLACVPQLINGKPCEPANHTSSIGTNLDFVGDNTVVPFVDVFKSARAWFPQCDPWADRPQLDCMPTDSWWDTQEELDLDANGWVRALPTPSAASRYWYAATLLLQYDDLDQAHPNYPPGQYVVLYDGEGTLEYEYAATKLDYLSAPGRDVIQVNPDKRGILMKLTATDPNRSGDYLRNVRVILPGHEWSYEERPFNPIYLTQLEHYNTLRFMDMMRTNNSPQWTWLNRPRESHAVYSTEDGVPLETLIDLSNELSADAWVNMPHMADDNYMTAFATKMYNDLGATQRVYVEYSNEVWNNIFDQSRWVQAKADEAFPAETNPFNRRINWYAKRTAEMCDIWKNVWSYESNRVTCVIGTQAGNPWLTRQLLECPLWEGERCVDHNIDAVAGAAYFGQHIGSPENEWVVEAWTNEPDKGLDKLFYELQTGGLLNDPDARTVDNAIEWMSRDQHIVNQYGLQHLAYEGGQHLVGFNGVENNWELTRLFTSANRDPRLASLYDRFLTAWQTSGSDLFVHYKSSSSYTKWGSWGAVEHLGQYASPKQTALNNFMAAQPCWWTSCVSVNGRRPVISFGQANVIDEDTMSLPVKIDSNNHSISSVSFAVSYDPSQLTPNRLVLNTPDDYVVSIEPKSGLIHVEITDRQAPFKPLADGELFNIVFSTQSNRVNLGFAHPTVHPTTCGNVYGQSVACR